ncbi:MAG: relaxase domain-containing protein [Nitrospirae bacterium]|nr:relaxase domain-containing protein [Nitrospirota bacterium]
MLSISGVTATKATSYFTKDDYYTKEQGEWQGKGAEALGLAGYIEKDEFKELTLGRNPQGNVLVTSQNGRDHRAGTDLTFSAPKSVSIVSEISGDIRIREAHQQAVTGALQYVETHFSQARITEGGVTERVQTGNLVIAKFDHDTSRALDPQLHTHAVVMNMTQRADGEWRALSNEKLYENKLLIGQIYRNELANNLKALGYEIQVGKNGLFEIKGVDPALIKEFSTRRDQIEQALNGRESGGALAEKITLMTREGKTHDVDRVALRQEWLNRSLELGYSRETIREQALQAGKAIGKETPKLEHLSEAIKFLEVQTAVWSKEEMVKSALKSGLSEGLTINQVEKRIDQALESRELVQLGENKYSSIEAIKTEQKIVDLVQNRQDLFLPGDSNRINTALKEFGAHFNQGQQGAVRLMTETRDGVVGIQGHAGVGKTTMLSVANQYWVKEGFDPRGLSFTGKAAEVLQNEAGIKSQTLHSFLNEKAQGQEVGSSKSQVWILDEASMVGNKQMAGLLKLADRENARVVLIGDTHQLQAIDAGKPFQMLQERGIMVTAKMDEILRQKTEGLKEAVQAIAKELDTGKAVNILNERGQILEINNRFERHMAIAKDYLALSPKEMKNTLIVTARNADRLEINQYIRDGLKQQGQINEKLEKIFTVAIPKTIPEGELKRGESYSPGDLVRFARANQGMEIATGERGIVKQIDGNRLTVHLDRANRTVLVDLEKYHKLTVYSAEPRQFAPGDQMMFLKNDKDLGVVNGSVGIVAKTGEDSLKVETRNGTKEVDLRKYDYIDHAYGSTLHKSQGMTAERVMMNIDTGQAISNSANAFYVGLSRASHEAKVYTDNKEKLPEAVSHWQGKESTQNYEKGRVVESEKEHSKEEFHQRGDETKSNRGFELSI